MRSLINTNFNRTYNPNERQNVLCDIKRLLTSRDTESQSKACGYLIEAVSKYNCSSSERARLIEYLLDNDITVFLCEATSNLDSTLFRSILQCIRLLWRVKRFFEEEHASNSLSAIIRNLVHYTATDAFNAVEGCLHFICDLLNGIKEHGTTSALSHQSAYNTEQLLACLISLSSHINNKSNTILCSAFVLHALISYQPPSLDINGKIATLLGDVLDKWFELLMGGLNRIILVGENGDMGSMLLVTCQLGMDTIRLINALQKAKMPSDFVNTVLIDEQELTTLKDAALKIKKSIHNIIKELVIFNKDNQSMISTEAYGIYLKFLLSFIYENAKTEVLSDFCDFLFSKGYLIMLPQTQIIRNDPTIRKVSTLVLGEMLKALTAKYLYVQDSECNAICTKDIDMDLIDVQYGIENKQNIGMLLQKNQPYSLLIYIYFYCQSSENPEESTSPLLPFLIEYLLQIPKNLKLPGHITKALWLVFAMSTVSNGSLQSLEQRVYLEKATDRLVTLLNPKPPLYYTHNPAILFWTFTSLRIPNILRLQVLSEWFKIENNLPSDLTKEPLIWELLLNIIIQSKDSGIITNCMDALNMCMKDANENARDEFATLIWSLLPNILSNALIDQDNNLADTNIIYILDLAIKQLPSDLVQSTYIKIAVLITTLYSKNTPDSNMESRNHFEYVCLKLCLLLLDVSRDHKDNKVPDVSNALQLSWSRERLSHDHVLSLLTMLFDHVVLFYLSNIHIKCLTVLLTYTNRVGFLPTVLVATNSSDDRVACIALQLLSCIVYYFAKNKFQPKSIIEIKTDLIVKSLRHESDNERGSYLLQLVYMVLNSSTNTPLGLTFNSDLVDVNQQWNVLRALMFRIQMMLCCRETTNQSPAGWKTLSSIFKHAIAYKNDANLVAILTSQPWTHVLIQFQLTLKITPEFLTFTQNWLTFLKITIKKAREMSKIHISKHSRIIKTLVLLKKGLVSEELEDANKNIISIVNDIMDECNSED